MKELLLRLENYFFPHQEVRANPTYDPRGDRRGSHTNTAFAILPVEDRENAFAVEVQIALDEEKSINPPYFFTMHAFGVFSIDQEIETSAASPANIGGVQGAQILIGAIREHLATMTARGPWDVFLLAPVPIQVEVSSAPSQQPSQSTGAE